MTNNQPWWREPTRGQWAAFAAAYFAWTLDSFDFNVYSMEAAKIGKEFGVSTTSTMWVISLTLLTRLIGGVVAGTLGDKYGRKLPLLIAIVWIAVCDGAIALAPNFTWVIVLRALFGFGMGAVWVSSATMAMENWPVRSRGIASGILQGGWAVGFFLAALVASHISDQWGWRAVFVASAAPGLLAIPIHFFVPDSSNHAAQKAAGVVPISWGELLSNKTVVRNLVWGVFVMAFGFCEYYGFTQLYPKLATVLVGEYSLYVYLFSAGMLVGAPFFGWVASARGPATAIIGASTGALIAAPFCLGIFPTPVSATVLAIGAVFVGACGGGVAGVTPALLTATYPQAIRARAMGSVYNVGAFASAGVSPLIAWMNDKQGFELGQAMGVVAGSALILLMISMAFRPKVVVA